MRVGSLFTGAGGLDLAVRQLWPDAELAWWSEVDEHAAASFARHTDAENLGDITQIDWTAVPEVDVVFGGFPCQDLSVAGTRGGLSADRSGLWFHMLDAINTVRPSLVLLENVTGIYTATGDDDELDVDRDPMDRRAAEPARAIDVVLGTLAEDGWDAEWADYRASDVGAPHRRARWFCVAYADDQGLEGWDTGGVRERGRQRSAGQGYPPADVTLLPTPRSSDGPKGTRSRAGAQREADRGVNVDLPTATALLPTPRSAADRTSRAALTRDGHWSAPALGQAVELAQGILPREYESWDEVQGWHGNLLLTPRATRGGSHTETQNLLPTPTAQAAKHAAPTDYELSDERAHLDNHNLWVAVGKPDRWGGYAAAIARWEHIIGRPAPSPTDDKGRLSPDFVEWMMGWPPNFTAGSRSQRLKQCGNGVVPLQAATAYRQLLDRIRHNDG